MGGSEPQTALCSREAEEGGQSPGRREGKEGGKEARGGVFQPGLGGLAAQPPGLLGLLPPPGSALRCAALLSPAKRPLAMGVPVLRSALLLPPALLLLLLLLVPPSRGFPGRSQRWGFLPSWTPGSPDRPLEPFTPDQGGAGATLCLLPTRLS